MPHQATVTAQTGPAKQLTTQVIPNVIRADFDLNDKVLQLYQDGQPQNVKEFDLQSVTVLTCTIAAGNYAFVLS